MSIGSAKIIKMIKKNKIVAKGFRKDILSKSKFKFRKYFEILSLPRGTKVSIETSNESSSILKDFDRREGTIRYFINPNHVMIEFDKSTDHPIPLNNIYYSDEVKISVLKRLFYFFYNKFIVFRYDIE